MNSFHQLFLLDSFVSLAKDVDPPGENLTVMGKDIFLPNVSLGEMLVFIWKDVFCRIPGGGELLHSNFVYCGGNSRRNSFHVLFCNSLFPLL